MGNPPRRFQRSPNNARARCEADGRRLPYHWYEDACLLWHEEHHKAWKWRTPEVDEIEAMLGCPIGYTAAPYLGNGNRQMKLPAEKAVETARKHMECALPAGFRFVYPVLFRDPVHLK